MRIREMGPFLAERIQTYSRFYIWLYISHTDDSLARYVVAAPGEHFPLAKTVNVHSQKKLMHIVEYEI